MSVTVPDLHGIARGKKVPARRVLESGASPMRMSNLMVMLDYAGIPHPPPENDDRWWPSWSEGYADTRMVVDAATARIVPWQPGTGLVVGDFEHVDGRGVLEYLPRATLKRLDRRLADLGFESRASIEMEFMLLDETHRTVAEKGLSESGACCGPTPQAYRLTTLGVHDELLSGMSRALEGFGLPVEAWNVEGGPRAGRDQPGARGGPAGGGPGLPVQARRQGTGRCPGGVRHLHRQALAGWLRQRHPPEFLALARRRKTPFHSAVVGDGHVAGHAALRRRRGAHAAGIHADVRAHRQRLPPVRPVLLHRHDVVLGVRQQVERHPLRHGKRIAHPHRAAYRRRRRQSLPAGRRLHRRGPVRHRERTRTAAAHPGGCLRGHRARPGARNHGASARPVRAERGCQRVPRRRLRALSMPTAAVSNPGALPRRRRAPRQQGLPIGRSARYLEMV